MSIVRGCMNVSIRLIFLIVVKYMYPKVYHFNRF